MEHGVYQRCEHQPHHLVPIKCSVFEYAVVCEQAEIGPAGLPIVTQTTDNFRQNDMLLECDGCLVSEWDSVTDPPRDNMYRIVVVRGIENDCLENPIVQEITKHTTLLTKVKDLQEENKQLQERLKEDHDSNRRNYPVSFFSKRTEQRSNPEQFNQVHKADEFSALKSRVILLQEFIEEKNSHLLQIERRLLNLQRDYNALSGDPQAYAKLSSERDTKHAHLKHITSLINKEAPHLVPYMRQKPGDMSKNPNHISQLITKANNRQSKKLNKEAEEEEWC